MSVLGPFERLVPDCGREAAERMAAHWRLLCEWQKTTNLTGIKDVEAAVTLHYEDALVALKAWPSGTSLLDVGSGAGLPGLVLAAVRPQADITLLEPRRLRLEFLREAVATLGLPHVRVVGGTLASATGIQADCMTMRAVFARDEQLDACVPHLRRQGRLLVFRQGGAHAQSAPQQLELVQCHAYRLAGHAPPRSLDVWQVRAAQRR